MCRVKRQHGGSDDILPPVIPGAHSTELLGALAGYQAELHQSLEDADSGRVLQGTPPHCWHPCMSLQLSPRRTHQPRRPASLTPPHPTLPTAKDVDERNVELPEEKEQKGMPHDLETPDAQPAWCSCEWCAHEVKARRRLCCRNRATCTRVALADEIAEIVLAPITDVDVDRYPWRHSQPANAAAATPAQNRMICYRRLWSVLRDAGAVQGSSQVVLPSCCRFPVTQMY